MGVNFTMKCTLGLTVCLKTMALASSWHPSGSRLRAKVPFSNASYDIVKSFIDQLVMKAEPIA